jgi:hypothetical protein
MSTNGFCSHQNLPGWKTVLVGESTISIALNTRDLAISLLFLTGFGHFRDASIEQLFFILGGSS